MKVLFFFYKSHTFKMAIQVDNTYTHKHLIIIIKGGIFILGQEYQYESVTSIIEQ